MGGLVERLAHFVLLHRRLVILGWALMFVIGGMTAAKVPDRLNIDFSLPGQQGYETSKDVLEEFGNGGPTSNTPVIVTATVPEGQTIPDRASDIEPVLAKLGEIIPGGRIADYFSADEDLFLTEDRRTMFAYVYPEEFTSFDYAPWEELQPPLDEAMENTDIDWATTGYGKLSEGGDSDEESSLFIETMIGGLGALAVLLFLFASLLAFIPLLIAAVSILTTFLVVLLATYVMDVSFVVQFLIALVGLGVAIDYSLLVVNRWREERAHGRDNHDAVVIAMKYAGHAVVASAGTVAISLCALLVIPVPLLRSMGIGGMLIPVISTLVVCTLLPAVLGGIGPRVDWPRIRHEDKPSRGWSAWARGVVRSRWLAAGLATIALALLTAPIFGIKIGQARTESLASGGTAYEALQTLHSGGVAPGVVSPIEVLLTGPEANESAGKVVAAAEATDGVYAAFAPANEQWRTGDAVLVDVIPNAETVDTTEAGIVDTLAANFEGIPGVVGLSGSGPTIQDYIEAVYKNFPYSLALIALVTFLLLVRTFRSILLPLKAVLLNIFSVAATFGATVLFWQHGYGSEQIFDIEATGAITFWVPLVIFAFLFGLSMDYEVFILARMREEYDRTGHTDTAVIEGLARTGRLVTGAALILFLAFVALAASPGTEIKVLATGLGIGILLDATIVRAVLVPALVSLFGDWNWWLPAWIAKPLRLEPHPRPGKTLPVAPPPEEPELVPTPTGSGRPPG
ncbi:MMPL family transporter [Sporichthya polymorpha]|uniref:MMPL family transporter n=1 Tax=Sporichthya polymorpha TaxID=35751 RepID=UPI001B7F978B|nr:MMPL family transporter [Sporichthya polymorpha]